jgi:hypothetical protein
LRDVGLLHEAQNVGVEPQRLLLVVHVDAGQSDLHGPLLWSLGWDLSMHRAYGRGHTVASRFLTGRFSIPDRMPLKYQSILVTAA